MITIIYYRRHRADALALKEPTDVGASGGAQFRRDVILQDQVNLIDKTIQATQSYMSNTKNQSQNSMDFKNSVIKQLQNKKSNIVKE